MARDVERDAPLDVSSDGFAGRLEVLSGSTGRARRSDELKARIAAESWAPGATVADVARRHGATRWQVYKWRQLVKRGTLPFLTAESETLAFAAVVVEEPGSKASPASADGGRGGYRRDCGGRRGDPCAGAHRGGASRAGDPRGAAGGAVIPVSGGVRVYIATRPVDFRKGHDGLAAVVQEVLKLDPFCGAIFVFRSKRADRLKLIVWDGTGLVLAHKRLENGKFAWPKITDGVMKLSPAQFSALVEGLDWRVVRSARQPRPTSAG